MTSLLKLIGNPIVRMVLPYLLGLIGIVSVYLWVRDQGYEACEADFRAAQSEMVREANKKANELRKQNDDLSELVHKLQEEADEDTSDAGGISNSSRMRIDQIR